MENGLNVLSSFDGMSCGQLALERAGVKVNNYFASEIDKYAMQVTMKNHPNTIQLGDVTKWREWDLPKIDLAMAGSPCQGFSIAGQGLDFDDPRSKLFFEYVDIIRAVKPKYFLLENVKMKKWCQDVISDHLGVEPIKINSSLLSAQNRERLYWTNIPGVTQPEDKGIMLDSVLEDEVDEKYYISTERAIEICDIEAKRGKIGFIGKDQQGRRIYSIHGKSVTLKALGGGWGAKTGLYWIPCLTPDRVKQRQNGPRFKPSNAKFYTLTAQDKHGILMHGQIRRLTPLECERLQTVPEGYTDSVSDTQRYKMLGNGWTVDVIAHILKGIGEEPIVPKKPNKPKYEQLSLF